MDPDEVFIFLLQAERIHLKHMEAADTITISLLIDNAIADGYFANPTGEAISKNEFQDYYHEVINGSKDDKEFEFYKNGQQQLPEQILLIDELQFVTAYANQWNNKQYFIETKNAWLLFGWGTMA